MIMLVAVVMAAGKSKIFILVKKTWLQIINVCALSAEKRDVQVWQLCSWEDGKLIWDDGERKLRVVLSFFDHSSIGIPRNTYNLVIIFLFFNNFFAFCSLCDIFPKERDQYMRLFTREFRWLTSWSPCPLLFPKSSQHLPTPLFITTLGHIPLSHLFFFTTFKHQQIFTLSFHLSLKIKNKWYKRLTSSQSGAYICIVWVQCPFLVLMLSWMALVILGAI